MNLFVIGCSSRRDVQPRLAEEALRGLLGRLPAFGLEDMKGWTAPSGAAAAAWSAHPPQRVGGVDYVHSEPERLALFAGRPIVWSGPQAADGRAPLDAAFWLSATAGADAGDLDGRFSAAAYDDRRRTLELRTDPLGAYPVFEAASRGVRWFSNSPEVLRALLGTREVRLPVLASLLGGGWSLTGDPLWAEVRRLPPGRHSIGPEGGGRHVDLLPTEAVADLFGAPLDAAAAADDLRAATRALADWPGRPSVVPVTGGRDSRLVLAAALAAGVDFEAGTQGYSGMEELEVGREVCAAAGVPHRSLPGDGYGDAFSAPLDAAGFVELAGAGTVSLADGVRSACGRDAGRFPCGPGVFPLGPRTGPLPLFHTGQGGELARGFYGFGREGEGARDLGRRLYRLFSGSRPWRRELLSAPGREAVMRELEAWVGSRLEQGCAPVDIPDLFYLERRMATWAGPTQACVEYVQDSASPLWSVRLLPHLLALSPAERAAESFHRSVLDELAPRLAGVRMEGGRSWAPRPEPVWRRRLGPAHAAGRKARAELARRLAPLGHRRDGRLPAAHPLDRVRALVRDHALDHGDHPAWAVLDRARVERLLRRDAAGLDGTRCQYLWRLATVFLPGEG